MNIINFNLIFLIPFFLVYFTVTYNNHRTQWQCKIAHVFFFLLHLGIMLNCKRVFQTKLNPIENCTRVWFSTCLWFNHVKSHTRFCFKSLKIPTERKGRQYVTMAKTKRTIVDLQNTTQKTIFYPTARFFSQETKSDF